MANDFVNTITTSSGTTYDVQDKRLTVTAADAGKVVSVDENSNLTLTTLSSGGTRLFKHKLSNSGNYLEVISVCGLPFNNANMDYKLNIISCNYLYYDDIYYTVIAVKELRLTSTKLLLLNNSDNSFYGFDFNNLTDTVTEL